MVFGNGAIAYIIESNRIIREVTVVKRSGEFYLLKFSNGSGGIRVRKNRLYATKQDAENGLPKSGMPQKNRYHSPYDFWH